MTEMVEWPKWVLAHPSHIVGNAAPHFAQAFKNRDGVWMVLVDTAEDEARALTGPAEAEVVPVADATPLESE